MPRISYVPSDRVLRVTWGIAGAVFLLILAGLTYTTITTAIELSATNARLDESQAQQVRLQNKVRDSGVILSFVNDGPNGSGDTTFRCRSRNPDTYVCTPEQKP